MSWIKGRRPSPSMMVAGTALVVALAGTAIAGPLATKSVLSKADKKQVKQIAKNQVNSLAPGLSVAHAQTAGNANTLGGSPLADLAPVAQNADFGCDPVDAFATDCIGTTLTINRTSDVLVMVTGTWRSPDATDANVSADCRIERNDAATSITNTYGSENDDTVSTLYHRQVAITELDPNLAPGSYLFELSCDLEEGVFDLTDLETTAIALGS